jgi:hypothetical protein
METTPDSPAPSTEELGELEAEFARLETELAALDEADEAAPVETADGGEG